MLKAARCRTAVVCEDDPVSQKIVGAALAHSGYTVVACVDTAMDALRAAMLHQPDVMVLDLMLPWVSGEFAISAITQEAPDCTIVVCSAHDPEAALANGAEFAVPKGAIAELEAVLWALSSRVA